MPRVRHALAGQEMHMTSLPASLELDQLTIPWRKKTALLHPHHAAKTHLQLLDHRSRLREDRHCPWEITPLQLSGKCKDEKS